MGLSKQIIKTITSYKRFFDDRLLGLIRNLKMQDNIYVVFQVVMIVYDWKLESYFDLAVQLRKEFSTFQEKIKKKFHL